MERATRGRPSAGPRAAAHQGCRPQSWGGRVTGFPREAAREEPQGAAGFMRSGRHCAQPAFPFFFFMRTSQIGKNCFSVFLISSPSEEARGLFVNSLDQESVFSYSVLHSKACVCKLGDATGERERGGKI